MKKHTILKDVDNCRKPRVKTGVYLEFVCFDASLVHFTVTDEFSEVWILNRRKRWCVNLQLNGVGLFTGLPLSGLPRPASEEWLVQLLQFFTNFSRSLSVTDYTTSKSEMKSCN